ncbi:MAG: peptidase M14 [Planctomycetes bacterium]|nr:peptidase M14 [Planctomycetota bacterium]
MTRLAAVLSFVLCCAATVAQVPEALPQRPGPLPAETRYDPAIPTLTQVNGHAPGERISTHADVERYLLALQAAAPERIQVVRYGESWQGRGLYYAVVGRAKNVARRDAIRTAMQRLADPRGLSDQDADQLLRDLPAVGWLANCVHGDEPSGTDAALCVLYHLLAAQGDPVVDKVLDECLVLIDPLENPDGRDRFVFYTRAARGRFADPTPESAEHSQPWPTGRSNHALFDMNRDWFAMSQPETAARVGAFLDWWPLVYVDLHEMGGSSSYYFPPPSQPVNGEVTATQRQWLERYGRNNARWFDRYGFDYFTRESYDGFYPGYGDAWPMAHGSVGMTFEMASARGLVYRRSDEQLLLYRDGVRRHFTASMATLETLANGRDEAQRAFLKFRRDGAARGERGPVRSYVFPAVGDRTRLARLADLMVRQGIEVQVADGPLRSGAVRALGAADDAAGEAREFAAGAFVVSMAQPASSLATMLLRPHFDMEQQFLDEQRRREAKRRDLEFYDLTAWSLPLLFGVECVETTDAPQGRLRRLRAGEASSGAAPLRSEPPKVAYVVAWGQNGAAALLAELLRLGVRARCIDEPFTLDGRRYPAGSFIVRVVDQPELPGGLHRRIAELAAAHGVEPYCADSSWVDDGPNFGTGDGHTLKAPKLLMAWDRPVNTYSAGWLRYLLEQRYGLPVSVVRTRDLGRVELDRFTVLLLPEGGGYGDELGERGTKAVVGFVERGGVLVAFGSAVRWLMDEKVGLLASAAESRNGGKGGEGKKGGEEHGAAEEEAAAQGEDDDEPFDYEQAIRPDDESPPSTPGAILRVTVDTEHWLGFGYDGGACVVHDGSNILTPVKLDRGRNVAIYQQQDQLLAAGFAWPDSLRQLPQKAYLVHQPKGRGHVVAFAEDPNVRAFADGLNLLLLNAVLLTAGR